MAERTVDDLEKRLREASSTLNDCAILFAELHPEGYEDDIVRLGEAIVKVIEAQSTVYRLRPDLRPEYFGEDWKPSQ